MKPFFTIGPNQDVTDRRAGLGFLRCAAAILLLCSFIFPCHAGAQTKALILNTGNEYPRAAPDGTGFHDRIVKEAFRRIGIPAETVQLPSERALLNADRGIDDGNYARVAGMEKTYPNLVMVPVRIGEFTFTAFTRDFGETIQEWKDLKPFDVGIVIGWKILEANITGTRSLMQVKNGEALFRLLANGRVEVVVYDLIQGLALIKRLGLTGIRAMPIPLARRDMFLYLHRSHQELISSLAAALSDMEREGIIRDMTESSLKEEGLK